MRFRTSAFAGAAALGVLVASFGVGAQQAAKMPRVGVLSLGTTPSVTSPRDPNEGFRQGLRELGYVEGRDIVIEWRYADQRADRLADLAAELVRLKVDVIHGGGPAVRDAARSATTTIPIVAISGYDPVAEGWAVSLARPGGNVTGLTVSYPEVAGKQLEFLKAALPRLSRVAVLLDSAEDGPPSAPGNVQRTNALQAAGRTLGVQPQIVEMRSPADFDAAFATAVRQRAEGVIVLESAMQFFHRERLADLAKKHRLPTIGITRPVADAGYLMAYAVDLHDLHRRAARYVDSLLKGAKAGELPIERPTKFELVVNLKTAKALGLAIPPSLLRRADHVIE
jgi:putative ABC transport system substrate-binding protein